MARTSKYENQNTPLSTIAVKVISEAANMLTINDIEAAQIMHGISDGLLAEIMGLNKSAIPRIKKGDSPVPMSGKIALFLFLRTLENT
jgi:hypothetical protein